MKKSGSGRSGHGSRSSWGYPQKGPFCLWMAQICMKEGVRTVRTVAKHQELEQMYALTRPL